MEIAHHLGTASLFLDLIHRNVYILQVWGCHTNWALGGVLVITLICALSLLLFQGQLMRAAYLKGWRCCFESNLTGTFLHEMCVVLQSFYKF